MARCFGKQIYHPVLSKKKIMEVFVKSLKDSE